MDMQKVKKVSYIINTTIFLLVLGLMAFFFIFKVTFMTLFSIPTAFVYIIGYYLISKEKLDVYVRLIYFWITIYMGCSTVCLGNGFGFHLYCYSLIPIIFYTEYVSYKINRRVMKAVGISFCIIAVNLISTIYTAVCGAVYDRDPKISAVFLTVNSLSVFGFLVFYSSFMVRSAVSSEEKLSDLANVDQLTRLYNRRFMQNILEALPENSTEGSLAMADIDNFKMINDSYGHNAGDEVLRIVSQKMRQDCPDCKIARWGGEEFLILFPSGGISEGREVLENLRGDIAGEPVVFGEFRINVTLTIGLAPKAPDRSVDSWVQDADSKLYTGKTSGKNKIVV